jgi:DNA-binding transcriptional LysR family regulator
MDRFLAIRSFVRAVETGSFTAVATELGTSQPSISKRIAWLESQLGAILLERRTRELRLTSAGTRFLAHCRPLLHAFENAEQCVRDKGEMHGATLRVAAPVAFWRLQLRPRLKQFRMRYPEVHLDVHLSDQIEDLSKEGIDLTVRIGRLQNSDLIAQLIGSTRRILVASPEYLLRHEPPRRLEDLSTHSCVVYTGLLTTDVWTFPDGTGVRTIDVGGKFRTNSSEGVLSAAIDGYGIAYAPSWLVDTDIRAGRLRTVLENIQTEELPIWALKHTSRRSSVKVAALLGFLGQTFASDTLLAPKRAIPREVA